VSVLEQSLIQVVCELDEYGAARITDPYVFEDGLCDRHVEIIIA
jgi:hypothetical protein